MDKIAQADMDALHQLDRMLELRRKQEQLAAQIPPGVVTDQTQYSDGTVIFHFTHEMLGDLGQLKIVPMPAFMVPIGGCLINVEIFPDDPETDPQWEEKYRLLELMVNVCTAVLPEEKALRSPMAKAPVAREQRRLYLRCMECRHTGELRALVSQLTEQQFQHLVTAILDARTTASNQDRVGLQQRLDEVQDLWEQSHPPTSYTDEDFLE